MKILFIYPNSGAQVGFNYGVAQLAANLRQAGHQVAFWQLCEDIAPLPDEAAFAERIQQEAPDLVAFSVVTNQWAYTRQLAQWTRNAANVPIACGGIHALFHPEAILQTGLFDYVFRGECEDAFVEFVNRLATNESIADTRNLALIHDGQIRVNPVRPLPSLTHQPPKAYDLMDFQDLIDAKNGWVGLMASRGCPFSCTYCFNHQMTSIYRRDLACSFGELGYIRHVPVETLMDEIRHLQTTYQRITMFIFDDDLFTFDKDWVREFCRRYPQVTDLPFVVNAHVGFFDEELAVMLRRAGCRVVKFGLESGSEDLRRRILNRRMTNDQIIHAIDLVNRHDMHSSVFIILGFPYETPANLYETVDILAAARPGRFRWTYFFPYPGTRAHELSVEGGFIDEAKMAQLVNFTDDSCLDFGPEQNLLLRKIGSALPWFVNARLPGPVGDTCRQLTDELLNLDEPAFAARAPGLRDEDRAQSQRFIDLGLTHYAVKYNRFMGVSSDYFLNEK